MKIDIEFLKPYTGTLVWDCLNTVLSENLRFAEPKKTPQEIVKETNEWLNAAKGTLFAAINEIETALDGKDEAQRERYVFNILKEVHYLTYKLFIYKCFKCAIFMRRGEKRGEMLLLTQNTAKE